MDDGDVKGIRYTMVCLSYRGYWTSHDRPSESGINQDAKAGLQWIVKEHQGSNPGQNATTRPTVILYGQSIGCGFATNLAAASRTIRVDGLVLETPFTSTRAMLKALYPQKWLPYQYLWPFLRSHLNSWANLETIAVANGANSPAIHIIEAGKDELVPSTHGEELYQRCLDLGLPVERVKIPGALHNETSSRVSGKAAIQRSIALLAARS
jgi:uncharacterized protein